MRALRRAVETVRTNVRAFRSQTHFASLDALRGLASLSVACFHFGYASPGYLAPGPLRASAAYGLVGVEIFFVISGFVIPYALWRSDYRLADFGRFVARRVVRLDPPYFAAIGVILALSWLSSRMPGYGRPSFELPWAQIGLHLGYLNVFFGGDSGPYPWLNPAFWTLAIEFQYYLSVGLLYPCLASPSRPWLAAVVEACCLVGAVAFPSPWFLPHYAPLFLTGVTLFQYRAGLIRARTAVAALLALAVATAALLGTLLAVVGILTAVAIVAFDAKEGALFRIISFLGGISYSLYLLHIPIGGRVVHLGVTYARAPLARVAMLGLALAASIVAAWVFAQLIERPAQRYASRIQLHPRGGTRSPH